MSSLLAVVIDGRAYVPMPEYQQVWRKTVRFRQALRDVVWVLHEFSNTPVPPTQEKLLAKYRKTFGQIITALDELADAEQQELIDTAPGALDETEE